MARTPPAAAAPPEDRIPSVTDWRLLHRVSEVWEAVLEDCAAARESIAFEQYILTPDSIGRRLLDLFTERARAGVRVRVLVDAFGSGGLRDDEAVHRLREAGGTVAFYNRPMLRQFLHLPPRIHRDHRKVVLIDDETAWIGGVCFTDRMSDWRDTMMRLRGPLLRAIGDFFETSWARALTQETHRTQRRAPPEVVPPERAGRFRYVVNSPERPASRALYVLLRDQVRAARKSILLTTPYLGPDHGFMRDLRRALGRGVAVTIVLPGISDHPPLDVLGHAFAGRLARHGAVTRYYQPSMMHAKLAVVDGRWASVGSMNLDRLSFRLNLENAVVSDDPDFVAAVAAQVERDAGACGPVPPEVARWNRALDPLLRLAGHAL